MKFEFELDKMPTTQQQKGIKKVKGKLQFYDRRGTNNYSLKAQLMKNKPKECFEKNVPLKLSVDRKSTRLNSSHSEISRMPSSA